MLPSPRVTPRCPGVTFSPRGRLTAPGIPAPLPARGQLPELRWSPQAPAALEGAAPAAPGAGGRSTLPVPASPASAGLLPVPGSCLHFLLPLAPPRSPQHSRDAVARPGSAGYPPYGGGP